MYWSLITDMPRCHHHCDMLYIVCNISYITDDNVVCVMRRLTVLVNDHHVLHTFVDVFYSGNAGCVMCVYVNVMCVTLNYLDMHMLYPQIL